MGDLFGGCAERVMPSDGNDLLALQDIHSTVQVQREVQMAQDIWPPVEPDLYGKCGALLSPPKELVYVFSEEAQC